LPAHRKYLVPKGLKPVRRKLASGVLRLYWYHRATGKALEHDPQTAEGLLEVAGLDALSKQQTAASELPGGSFAALWLAYSARDSQAWTRLKPRTRSDYQAVRDWMGASAERAMVKGMTAESIRRLADRGASQRGRRFGNYVLQVVRLVLEWGKERGWLTHNPAMGMKQTRRPAGLRRVNRAWTLDELEAFAMDCPAQLLVPFVLGVFATMREGDAVRVTWSAYSGSRLVWIAGKNGEETSAPVTGLLKVILDEAKARRGKAVQIAVNSYGSPWSESGFRASFFKRLRALREAGAVMPGCTFHGLRATLGAMARDAGESEFRVAAAIGDLSPAMAQVYGRDADRARAQTEVLGAHQKRFANNDWKLPDATKGNRVTISGRQNARKPL
jgi:integrase